MRIGLAVLVDSKYLYISLSTQQNAIDKSIRADGNVIRFEYEVKNVYLICWLPGCTNLPDPGTKKNVPLCEALQLSMHTDKIVIDLSPECRRHDRSLG